VTEGRRRGRGWPHSSFHLYLLVFTLTIFFIQIPLGVFAAQSPLDSTAHVLLPAAATSLLYDAVYSRVVHSSTQYFFTMVLLGVSVEMVWEVIEFAGDAVFGLSWQLDNTDTMIDIMCGIAGAVLGAAIRLWIWSRTSRSRHPGRAPRRAAGLIGVALVLSLALLAYPGFLAWTPPAGPGAVAAALSPPGAALLLVPPPALAAPPIADPAPVDRSASASPTVSASVPIPSIGATIPVGATPGYVVVAPNGRHAYVANRAAGVVTVLDTAVNAVTATIPVPAGPPQYLAFSPDGRTVYISIWNEERTIAAVGVLDTTTNSVVATIPVRSRPFLAAVTPDGRWLYVPNHDSGTISIIDTAHNTITTEIRVAPNPHWVEFSRDGRVAYVANHESNVVSFIDTSTATVLAEVAVRLSPHSVAVHPTRPLVADVDYGSGSVTMIDSESERVVATIPVGHGPQDITWAPDGRFAYVANVNSDTVSVIDAGTMAVTATIPTGNAPTSVAVLPNGRQAFVTNLRDGTLTVLDIGG
jgi:YVTN family beta-propeller protein